MIRIDESRWKQLRDVRLAALEADPSAFGSSLERELAFTEDDWRARTATAATFLAVDESAAMGLVSGRRLPKSGAAELNALWVDPQRRGAGVGASPVGAVLDWTRADGGRLLRLWVTSGNAAAIRLYEQLGFRRTGAEKPLPSDPQLTEFEFSLSV